MQNGTRANHRTSVTHESPRISNKENNNNRRHENGVLEREHPTTCAAFVRALHCSIHLHEHPMK